MKTETKFLKFAYMSHFVLRAFLISLLCLLLGFGMVMFVYLGDLLVKDKSPLFNTYVIVTQSMVPTIMVDDGIVVKRVDNDKYKIGDIITFKSKDSRFEGLAVTHRIVEKQSLDNTNSVYTTKGDNNKLIDPVSVKTESIYGKVLFKLPQIGRAKEFFSHPGNFLMCLLGVSVIFILYNMTRIFVVISKKKKFSY